MTTPIHKHPPLLVAGPCSAESYEQLHELTQALARRVNYIRCGVWKPRTRPGGFEGRGEQALEWMQRLQAEYRVPFCCEVARPEQVERSLHHGITTLWIGARTSANPFLVSELCEALRGSGARVMVKNPICPDVRLWLGTLERMEQVGLTDLVAVHRGFAMYHNQGYRNAPLWEVALELRRERPDVPVICDPSHMGGRRDLLGSICHTARQLAYDGLMVEVHPHPEQALTDADQQITPADFARLIAPWMNDAPTPQATASARLEALRSIIDECDREILTQLAHRLEIARQIAIVKQQTVMPVYQPERWESVVANRLQLAEDLHLHPDFVKDLLEKIHVESVRVQLDNNQSDLL